MNIGKRKRLEPLRHKEGKLYGKKDSTTP